MKARELDVRSQRLTLVFLVAAAITSGAWFGREQTDVAVSTTMKDGRSV